MASVVQRIILCIFLGSSLCGSSILVQASSWTYLNDGTGPTNWTAISPMCGGSKQSPINIDTSSVKEEALGSFNLVGFGPDDIPEGATMTAENNGHSIVVNLEGDYMISGAGLGSTAYKAVQFHFHWGSVDTQGSEHTVDGTAYAGEMHVVAYNTKYPSFYESLPNADGLTVLGFLIGIQSEDNPAFAPLYDAFTNLKFYHDEYSLADPLVFSTLLPEGFESSFYRYAGSLTTPTCNEIVTWNVFKMPILISESQIGVFRGQYANELGDGENITLTDTFRPPQALNDRDVRLNVMSAGHQATASLVAMAAICLLASVLTE